MTLAIADRPPFLGTFPFHLAADVVPPPAAPGPPPVVAVLGDSFTTGYAWGGGGVAGWPTIVRDRLRLSVGNQATGGSGFVNVDNWSTFPHAAVTRLVPDARVVVVFGGVNDQRHDPVAVHLAAVVTLAAARAAAPAAVLVLAGPQWSAHPLPAHMYAVRDGLAAAAHQAGAMYVDPSSWLSGRHDLIGPDGLHPTDGGHLLIAQRMAPIIAAAVDQQTRGQAT